jgi:hypothetical protein
LKDCLQDGTRWRPLRRGAAHIDLILNHIPILGTMIFAPLVLGWGLLRRSRDIVQTGLLLTIILAVTTIPPQ